MNFNEGRCFIAELVLDKEISISDYKITVVVGSQG
jgi:hypothetical protein